MALTALQRRVCRLLASERKRSGESYVAGGLALNTVLAGARQSRDVDIFHDTVEALQSSWARDRETLRRDGLAVHVLREARSFVEASASRGDEVVVLQWTHHSAYRYFPLLEHDELGLTLSIPAASEVPFRGSSRGRARLSTTSSLAIPFSRYLGRTGSTGSRRSL